MRKFLKYTGIAIGILIIILVLAPLLFKKQIVSKIKQEANNQLNATLDFDPDISLGFFKHFPNASLGIKDLSIIGKGPFTGDTLAYVDQLDLVIDLTSLFGDKTYQIRNIVLNEPYVQLLVDSAGKVNWDITRPNTSTPTDTASTPFRVALQKYTINKGCLIFSDASNGFYLKANGLDHSGKGDFTQDIFNLDTHSHVKELTIAYGNIPYLNQIETDLGAILRIDVPHSKYSFKESVLKLNGLTLGVNGYIAMPDSNNIAMDLGFKSKEADFKNFLSLIPAIYQKNFDKLKTSGTMAISGFVKGRYNEDRIPAFELQLKINDGMFQYPSVPKPLSDVNLNLAVRNTDGLIDHTLINVKQLHFIMDNNPFDAHLTIKNPKSDPLVDGAVKGRLDLTSVSKIYPLEKGTTLGGILNLNVQAKGRLSAVENKKYDQFNANGQITANNIIYQSSGLPQGVKIPQGRLDFSPQQVRVSNLITNIGKSDIKANGNLDNFFGYLFGKDHLKGNLDINSRLLNLNEIMVADTMGAKDTSSQVKAVIIPKNIDFNLQARIGRFIYDNYDLTNVQGNIKIADGVLTMKNVNAHMLDGTAKLSGVYNTQNPKAPKTDLSLNVDHINVQKAFQTFNTIQALAPIAAFVQGNFSGNIDLSTLLNENLFPKLSSVNSLGKISFPDINIKGFAPLQKLASNLNIPQLKNLDIKKLLLTFKIDSGYLNVRPFNFTVDGIKMAVTGRNRLNKEIDYHVNMNIPRSRLGDVNKGLASLIRQANNAAGTHIDAGDNIEVGVHLGGTITNPQIKLDLSKEKNQVTNTLKSVAQQKLNQVLSGDTTKNDSADQAKPLKDNLKNKLQEGLKGLFNKKKDTSSKH